MDVKSARKEAIKQKYAKIAREMKAARKKMKIKVRPSTTKDQSFDWRTGVL